MRAYAFVPEWLALLLGAIAAFYFGSRHLEKRISLKGPNTEQIRAAKELAIDIEKRRAAGGPSIDGKTFRRAMEDTKRPL